jgi:putative membrane protein
MTDDGSDPRFSLANERTYLAWIRTALGLLAAAAGLMAIDVPWPMGVVRSLAVLLAVVAGACGFLAWHRWHAVQAAIEAQRTAPTPRAHVVLSITVAFVAGVVVVLILT